MQFSVFTCTAGILLQTALALPSYPRGLQSKPASTVFQLESNGTWFENLAVRSDGTLLATRIDAPELWSIEPNTNTSRPGRGALLTTFPNAMSTLGITELARDVFAVVAGNLSLPSVTPTPGSFAVWTVNLTGTVPSTQVLAHMPAADFLDGMAKFGDDLLLLTDASQGAIWRLNMTSGESCVMLSHPSMVPAAGQPPRQEVYGRFPVDGNARPTGPVEMIASGLFFDGFALMPDGTAYLTTNPQTEVIEVSPEGRVRLLAGSQFMLAVGGSTAAAVDQERSVLYVATSGAQFAPVMGRMEPAKVVGHFVVVCLTAV
ncbi:uncharacterized protein DSM5745_00979 [Aspergillus mulundensis]|uniref:SMP-30/Gluconolactonase/LRE-like region domain-containing protein n=1 Tax=Aspergillus mulundensis TaxID=1810919 RepID=A0A3D8T516_9EURO|nr:Uncharacterized protein DSM5745_00979 [Aspergillus mulundensis]RDW93657.1 Uncharacterized protein DSM5745_00979 [Aspergillus mulundensis]